MEILGENIELKDKQPATRKKIIPLKLIPSSNLKPHASSSDTATNKNNDDQSKSIGSSPFIDLTVTQITTAQARNHFVASLNWNLNVTNIGHKTDDSVMDYCPLCCLPILIYGRLLPCKHVMCIQCANNIGLQMCLKETCQEKIERIEKMSRGALFVCSFVDIDDSIENRTSDSAEFGLNPETSQREQCGRSYLSQRDLAAHVKHRHDELI